MHFLRSINLIRVAQATTAWGVLFAIVHFYWAAGGATGMNGDPADTLAAQAYIAVVAVLGLAGAGVAYALVHGGPLSRRTLTRVARAGAVALLLGVVVGSASWLEQGSLEGDGANGIAITLYFLLGGVLFSRLGWHARVRPGS